jgi:hypothetical protein
MFTVIIPLYGQMPLMTGGGVNELYAIMYNAERGEFVKVPVDYISEKDSWDINPQCIPIGANSRYFIFYSPAEGELFKINIDSMYEADPYYFPPYIQQ